MVLPKTRLIDDCQLARPRLLQSAPFSSPLTSGGQLYCYGALHTYRQARNCSTIARLVGNSSNENGRVQPARGQQHPVNRAAGTNTSIQHV